MTPRCWMLYRIFTFSTGETLAIPTSEAFSDPVAAQRAKAMHDGAFGQAIATGVMRVGQLAEEAPVKEFIEDLGIHGIGHTIIELAIKTPSEVIEASAESSIILPGARH